MNVLVILIPVSLGLGGLGLGGLGLGGLGLGGLGLAFFFWTLSRGQYDDPNGDAARILTDAHDTRPGR